MISREEALIIARNWAAEYSKEWRIEIIVPDDFVLEKPYGWFFSPVGKLYYETRDIKHSLFGLGPVLVLKKTGNIKVFSSRFGLETAAVDFEENNQEWELVLKSSIGVQEAMILRKILPLDLKRIHEIISGSNPVLAQGAQENLRGVQQKIRDHGLECEIQPRKSNPMI